MTVPAAAGTLLAVLLAVVLVPGCVLRPFAPAKGPRLVAAGKLKGNMQERQEVVGDLRIIKVASGQIVVNFIGYRMPTRSGQGRYLVQARAAPVGDMIIPAVDFEAYTAYGIALKVTDPDGRMPLPLKYLVEYEFTVEVNEILR